MSRTKLIAFLVTLAVCMPAGMALQGGQAQPSAKVVLTTVRPVFGWINETGTGNPVQAAVYFADMDGLGATNHTTSDAAGYYSLNLSVTGIHHFLMHGINGQYKLNMTDVWLDELIPWFMLNMGLDPAPPRNSSVHGFLTDAVTGQALANKTLTAASDDYLNSTDTAANGSFHLGLIPGEYTVGGNSAGYESSSLQFTLWENQSKWRNITLEPLNCTLTGIVRGSGSPLSGVHVWVEEPWNINPLGNDYENYTDGSGLYSMNLTRGTKTVSYYTDGFLVATRTANLNAGVNWLNLTLAPEPAETCTVRGFVRSLVTGFPIENASVRIGNSNSSWNNGTMTGGLGFYTFNAVPGHLRMEAEHGSFLRNGTEFTALAGQTVWQNITLTNASLPSAHLMGNITLDGLPVSSGTLGTSTWTDTYSVGTDGAGYFDIEVSGGYAEFAAMTTDSGSMSNVGTASFVLMPGQTIWHDFALHSLEFDSVVVGKARNQGGIAVEGAFLFFSNSVIGISTYETAAVSDFNGTYEISLPRDEQVSYMNLADGYLMQTGDFTPGQEWNWRNITLQSMGVPATLSGYLTDLDGNPVTGHEMMATADGWMNWTVTDSQGFFSIEVPRGDVYLSCQLDSYYDPGRILARTGLGGTVWMNVSVRPKPAHSEIAGTVRESDSTPVPNAEVIARFGDREFVTAADADGNYTLIVPEGWSYISARAPLYGGSQETALYTHRYISSFYWANITLDHSVASLELPVTETVSDGDGDGKIDWLYVDVQVNVASGGGYILEGSLYQDEWSMRLGGISNVRVASARNETELGTGLQTVRLEFTGPQIMLSAIDGYAVDLSLRDEDWNELDGMACQLSARNSTDFDSPDIEPASPWHSFGPVDTDFDGQYNMMLFNATIEVLAEGDYTVMAQLYSVPGAQRGSEMQEIDSEMEAMHLAAGTHDLEYSFSGTAIYNSGWHLGIASIMLFNSSNEIGESTVIGTSQAYVPYDYRQFQHYPADSSVYGWANDTLGNPIQDLRVELYNRTNRFVNSTHTDASGYYSLGCWGGSWLLVMEDDEDTSRQYQGNLSAVAVASGASSKQNRVMQDQVLDTNTLFIGFRNSDWNLASVDNVMGIESDNQTVRYNFDIHEFGNGDGFISEAEVDMLMVFLGAQISMPANLTDHMTVDGITYGLDAGSEAYDVGLVGDVLSREPIYIRQKANYTSQAAVAASSPHWLNVNLSYDDTFMGSMSEGNSTMVCHVSPPTNWGMTGHQPTANITFSGSDYITADPGPDPDTGDAFAYEWANMTVSDSQVPTVGSVAGNVTLEGRTEHFGVTVKVKLATTGTVIASASTDTYGHYSVQGLAPGNYNVTAEKPGYSSNCTNNTAVAAGATSWVPGMTLESFPPLITQVNFIPTVTNETAIDVYADVTDDGTVGDVTLMYTDVLGGNHALPMAKLGGITYRAAIPAQIDTGTVYFYILANDTIGNSARYPDPGTLSVTVIETVPPQFSNLAVLQDPTEYGDPTNATVTVTDSSALAGVWLYNHFTLTNTSMSMSSPGNYYLEDTFLTLGLYQFTVWATDAFGNVNHIDGSFTVQDSNAPVISDMSVNPQSPEFMGSANVSANITDLAGLAGAWLDARYPNGTALGNLTMLHSAADSYSVQFLCDIAGHYTFTVWAADSHGVSGSATGSFWVNDTVPPTIRNLTAPASTELGGPVNVTADIGDLGGLASVRLQMFGPDHQELFNESMNEGSYWYLFVPDEPGQYNFTVWVVDGNGLTNSSSSAFTVVDTVAPTFSSVNVIPQVQEVHGSVRVQAMINDIHSVQSCHLNLTSPTGDWLSNTSMSFSGNMFSLNRTYSLLGDYTFVLWARDPSGNFNSFAGTITTEDTQAPAANAGIDRTVPAGTAVTLDAGSSTDNYGIANYTWTLTDNGVQTLYGETADYTFTRAGTYDIELTVKDFAGLTDADIKVITVTEVATLGVVTGRVLNSERFPVAGVTVYIKDSAPRIETVTDSTGSFILENVPQGERTVVFVHPDYTVHETSVTVVAGSSVTTGDITLELRSSDNPCSAAFILAIIIGPLVLYYIWRKRKAKQKADETVIDEIFFMSNDGRLIKHFTRRLKPDMDQDILSGMLVAVQDFIKDSFRGEEGGLEELRFGKFQIVLGRGKHTIIAALILGDDTKPFRPQIEKCLKDIETNHQEALETWNGEVDKLTPSFRYINDLIAGKYA